MQKGDNKVNRGLQSRCDLLVNNNRIIRDSFKWESGLMSLACAGLFAGEGKTADPERLKMCVKIVKENTGSLSDFRGNAKLPLICKMALAKDPAQYLMNVKAAYGLVQLNKWFGSAYQVMAAIAICGHAGDDQIEEYAAKTKEIFSRMKEKHPWLTSDEDIPFAAMLAVSDLDTDSLISEMEKNYEILKQKFSDKNAVQTLSHVLAIDKKQPDEKCRKVIAVFDGLKERKHRFGTGFELASLGALNMLDQPADEIVDLIIDADEYLKGQMGFGDFTLGAKERRLFAAQMAADEYRTEENIGDHYVLLNGMMAYMICLEICMIIIMTSCISSATTNS